MIALKYLKGTKEPIRNLLRSIPLDPPYISLKFFKENSLKEFLKYNQEQRNHKEFLIDYDQLETIQGLQNPRIATIDYLKRRNLDKFLDEIKEFHLRFTDEDPKIIKKEGWSKDPSEIKIVKDNIEKYNSFKLIEIILQNSLLQNSREKLENWFSNLPQVNA